GRCDAPQPAPEGVLGQRLLRPCHAVLRHRVRPLAPGPRAGRAQEHHLWLLSVGSHDLYRPAVASAEQGGLVALLRRRGTVSQLPPFDDAEEQPQDPSRRRLLGGLAAAGAALAVGGAPTMAGTASKAVVGDTPLDAALRKHIQRVVVIYA